MTCSSPSHLPSSINLHRREQKGPCGPANQCPTLRHVGHFTSGTEWHITYAAHCAEPRRTSTPTALSRLAAEMAKFRFEPVT